MTAALTDFAKYVRPEVPGCAEPLLLDAILESCIDFCTRSELLSEIVEQVLVASTKTYSLTPTDATLYPARLRAVLNDGVELTPTNAASYTLLSERTDSGTPTYYFSPTRSQVTLAPVPDTAATLEFDLVLRPVRTATTVPSVLFDEWAKAVANGAKAQLLAQVGRPWANAALAGYFQGLYDDAVATAAAQVAMGNTGAAMHVAVSPL
jgi:hypothetical protein